MVDTTKPSFLTCKPQHYKGSLVADFSEIISAEEPCSYIYSYTLGEGTAPICGEKTLYAYPQDWEKLVLGHTVLDVLPWYTNSLQYDVQWQDDKLKVVLEVNSASQAPKQAYVPRMTFSQVITTMDEVLSAPGLWDGTGCFHRAALYDPRSKKFIFAEDIGRHNCVDRLKGHALMQGLHLEEYFFFTTARITASLYAKLRRAGIKYMVSRAAITSTTYTRAQAEDCTVAGFCRPKEERVTLFAGEGIVE